MIEKLDNLPLTDLRPLIEESVGDGFRFLERLISEWNSGSNRFEKSNEGLYGYRIEGSLVAIGGINIDPFSENHRIGRLRRFYVAKSKRRNGIGRELVQHILSEARTSFDWITLKTDMPSAAKFYESLGFTPTNLSTSVTHAKKMENQSLQRTRASALR